MASVAVGQAFALVVDGAVPQRGKLVVEGVAPDLADEITAAVKCPTIGIGASSRCDGQILVTNDLLGMTDWVPKFVKKNADLKSVIEDAAATYAEEVKSRAFPGEAQTYKLRKTT